MVMRRSLNEQEDETAQSVFNKSMKERSEGRMKGKKFNKVQNREKRKKGKIEGRKMRKYCS